MSLFDKTENYFKMIHVLLINWLKIVKNTIKIKVDGVLNINKALFNKEGERYNAWIQLDLAEKNDKGQHPMLQYHDRYGFDLEKS